MTRRFSAAAKRLLNYREGGLVIALLLLLIVARVVTPAFFAWDSLSAMLTNNAVYAVLTVGLMFVLLTGGIDLSIGAVLAVSGVTVTRLMVDHPQLPVVALVVIGVLIGGLCGGINGVLVGRLRIVPMIATLGTMYVFRGLAYVISRGEWTFSHAFTEPFLALTQTKWCGLRAIVWWTVLLFVLAGWFLSLTRPGRRLYAVGSNEASAVVAGIAVGRVRVSAYVLCGLCAGLAGVLYASDYAMVNSDIGAGYEMTAIATCILGGVSITGGRGRIDGVAIAALLMSVLTYLLSLLPGFSVWKNALQGVIILVAVAVNLCNGRLADKRAMAEKAALV